MPRELPIFESFLITGVKLCITRLMARLNPKFTFQRLRNLRERLRQNCPEGSDLVVLSMGMSGDFEIAIEEGRQRFGSAFSINSLTKTEGNFEQVANFRGAGFEGKKLII